MDRPCRRTLVLSSDIGRLLRRRPGCLARREFKVLTGRTGRRVLDLAARVRPAAVVLGSRLEDLHADEVCRAVGARSLRPVPVLVVGSSARAPAVLKRLAELLGVRLRLHSRFSLVAPVSFGRAIQEFLGYTRDVSEGGALIESAIRIRPGRRLLLRLDPDERPPLILPAVAVRVDDAPQGDLCMLGMQFVRPGPATRARLKSVFAR